jgi:hypothetical protein
MIVLKKRGRIRLRLGCQEQIPGISPTEKAKVLQVDRFMLQGSIVYKGGTRRMTGNLHVYSDDRQGLHFDGVQGGGEQALQQLTHAELSRYDETMREFC